jgi:hypothetical protein
VSSLIDPANGRVGASPKAAQIAFEVEPVLPSLLAQSFARGYVYCTPSDKSLW